MFLNINIINENTSYFIVTFKKLELSNPKMKLSRFNLFFMVLASYYVHCSAKGGWVVAEILFEIRPH